MSSSQAYAKQKTEGQHRPDDPTILRLPLPSETLIAQTLDRLDLAETQQMVLQLDHPPTLEQLVRMPNTPRWAHLLTYLRDIMLKPLGFGRKNHQPITDNTPDFSCRIGERRGEFTVIATDDDELVLAQEDGHQSIRLGYRVFQQGADTVIQLNTAVQYHTLAGELYMGLILPLQRQILRADLDNMQRQLRGQKPRYEVAKPE